MAPSARHIRNDGGRSDSAADCFTRTPAENAPLSGVAAPSCRSLSGASHSADGAHAELHPLAPYCGKGDAFFAQPRMRMSDVLKLSELREYAVGPMRRGGFNRLVQRARKTRNAPAESAVNHREGQRLRRMASDGSDCIM